MPHRPTPVILAPGTLPPTWERPGIFVANLLSLFFGNEAQTEALRQTVGRLESYGGRLLPIMGLLYRGAHPNIVVLEQAPQQALLNYFADTLALDLPQTHVLPHDDLAALATAGADLRDAPATVDALLPHLQAAPDAWLDGFVTDPALLALATRAGHQTLNQPTASFAGNNKHLLHDFLVATELPVFTTQLVPELAALPAALRQLAAAGFARAALKSPIGASGIGLWTYATDDPAPAPPAYAFAHGPCLLQGWVDASIDTTITATRSPSAQLLVRPEAVHVYDLTDQILSADSIHQGNAAPPPWLTDSAEARGELLRQASLVGRWLHRQDYRGTASIDFHVTEHADGSHVIRVCEVNARVTGATYPALLARHFNPTGAWLMRNVRFDPAPPAATILQRLREADLLYQPGATAGLLPINFNPAPDDHGIAKGQFLCLAPDLPAATQLLEALPQHLPVADSFDRD
ncbi:hypothetical protein [Actomonas aquatica]|uniref:ATP-grasp domain-containing protein n=1 Tax=Actomonas aquatica TaxID=2866162 RepID=A0ABZ1C366_9BACT|nr:hypothetical protein [Opitutus sp. WL0086]WRQ85792.1 hypothetical protein K1X11_013350 [Opitutus sp. WL0086]